MAITAKTTKILWANAAGRCAFPVCREKLCTDGAAEVLHHTLGEMAHICGERPGSNRHDQRQSPEERDDYPNLVLLCSHHHTVIDKPENEQRFSVEVLRKLKADHEAWVAGRFSSTTFTDKYAVARFLYPIMMENRQVFLSLGPTSEIARRNPNSDAYEVWLTERLATIIPNNRQMLEVVKEYGSLFGPGEQEVLGKFALHVRSYERWVRDEVSYEGVVRFPQEFDLMVTEISRACS